MNQLLKEAQEMKEELISWRRQFHQIPEVGLTLPKTVAFVTAQLDKMGVEYEVYEDCSCVVAKIGSGDRAVLLRGDMDALQIEEESGEEFASTNGCMHGCGHDMHATALLGAAKLLKQHEAELPGMVKLLFQSGEEVFLGAKAAVEHGVLESPKVEAAMALHVFAALPIKTAAWGVHPMASVYGFRIVVTGKGTHGSSPELGVDPITVGAHILLGLQELISREVTAFKEAALTIGKFQGGQAANVIPQYVEMEGTLRTFDPEVREFLIQRITDIAEGVAKTYRAEAKVEVLSSCPAVVCDEALLGEACESIKKVSEEYQILNALKAMGSEDFAVISEKVPSVLFAVGAGVPDQSKWYPQHNPKIVFNEEVLPYNAAVYAQFAMDYYKNH